jgi:transcription elongation factor Elf1
MNYKCTQCGSEHLSVRQPSRPSYKVCLQCGAMNSHEDFKFADIYEQLESIRDKIAELEKDK